MDTKDISVPANEERVWGGTRVWVNSWVVRSKVQRPRRESDKKVKSDMAAKVGLVGEASATIRESNTEETSPLDELIRQIARTTGTYSKVVSNGASHVLTETG